MHRLRTGLAAGIAALEGRRAEAVGPFRGIVTEALEHGDGFEAANDALTAVVLLGLVLTALVMVGAPLIEALFAAPGLALLVFWMAPSILFTALGAVPVALSAFTATVTAAR